MKSIIRAGETAVLGFRVAQQVVATETYTVLVWCQKPDGSRVYSLPATPIPLHRFSVDPTGLRTVSFPTSDSAQHGRYQFGAIVCTLAEMDDVLVRHGDDQKRRIQELIADTANRPPAIIPNQEFMVG